MIRYKAFQLTLKTLRNCYVVCRRYHKGLGL